MKKIVLIIIYIILILISLKLLYNIGTNSILINQYNQGKYDSNQGKKLTYLNFIQGYVANYNYGNILFQNGEYENAIEEYKKALKRMIPKEKECNIRINYALTICKTVEVDEKDQESIRKAIETYETAIGILTEEGCANKNDNNGHSQKAEQLKEDIEKEIDRLKKLQKQEDNNQKEEQEETEDSKTTEEIETIEEKIQNIKQEAIKDQRDLESEFDNYNKDIQSNTKNW